MTEQQIIQAVLNGNTIKFSVLVEKYQNLVFRTAMGFVHSKENAEDLTQDIFIKAYQSLATYQGDSEFSTWLYRIAVNTSINQLNRNKQRILLQYAGELIHSIFNKESHDRDPLQELEQTEQDTAIRKAIDSLPDKQRTAFVLSKYDDLSQKEISEIMRITEGAVEQLLQRAKIKLQKKLST